MAHCRLVNLRFLGLVVLLVLLKFVELAVDLSCDVIEDDGDRCFSKIVLRLDLHRDELLAFLRLLHIAILAQEVAIIQMLLAMHFNDNFIRLLWKAIRALLRKDLLKR